MPPILDVAIGLLFVFLLFSLVVTAAREIAAAFTTSSWDKRAQLLQEGIGELLCDPNVAGGFTSRFFDHPLIKALSPKGDSSIPNYIPRESFVSTVLDLIHQPEPGRPRGADDLLVGIFGSLEPLLIKQASAVLDKLTAKYPTDPNINACLTALQSAATDPVQRTNFLTALGALKTTLAIDVTTAAGLLATARTALRAAPTDSAVIGAAANAEAGHGAMVELQQGIVAVESLVAKIQAGVAVANHVQGDLQTTLRALFEDAGHDVKEFEKQIGAWFDRSMDRVTGWYKKYTQGFTLILGLVLAIFCNVDSLRVIDTLSTDPKLRDQIVISATEYVEKQPVNGTATPADFAKLKNTVREMNGFGLPIGWHSGDWEKTWSSFDSGSRAVLGWLITALAGSLGAPFWFDTLNKIVTIRAGGRAPEEKNPGENGGDSNKKKGG